jgi:hypothetical protein
MQRPWHRRRPFHATEDGGRRWNHADQRLLHWSKRHESALSPASPPRLVRLPLEDADENGCLWACLDPAPKPRADD